MALHQHGKFLERLARSSETVLAVADWLHRSGRTVEIPATRFAPTADQADAFVDEGDIIIIERKIIQVKGISRDFTCRDDWPFGEYLVSNKEAVERMDGRVSAYVTVGKSLRCAAIVDGGSRKDWYLTNKKAANTGNVEAFYACSLDYVVFRKLGRDVGEVAA